MPPFYESTLPLSESPRTSGDSENSSTIISRNLSLTSSQSGSSTPTIKCVFVGDAGVGKTCLIASYSRPQESPHLGSYVPTTFDNYAVSVKVEGKPIKVQLCDTSGRDEFSSLRNAWYSEGDVFIVCYNVVDATSFHNATKKWAEEIKRLCPDKPIILAGLQMDRRCSSSHGVTAELAHEMADKIPCCEGFLECSSAESKERVKDVFDSAIFSALNHQGFVKKRRGLSSFRSKKYKCKSEMWNVDSNLEILSKNVIPLNSSQTYSRKKKSYSLKSIFSCFCGRS